MSSWSVIYNYMEKDIKYCQLNVIDDIQMLLADLSDTIIAIYFNEKKTKEEIIKLFQTIISKNPLAILISGLAAKEYFNLLLELLSVFETKEHIMTNVSEDKDWLDDFLLATWPSEERYGEWKSYSILEMDGNYIENNIKLFIEKK